MFDLIVTDTWYPLIVNMGLLLMIVLFFMRRNPALGVFLFSTFFYAYSFIPFLVSSSTDVKHHWFVNPNPIGLSITATIFFSVVVLMSVNKEMPLWSLFKRLPWLTKLAFFIFAVSIPIGYLTTVVTTGNYGMPLPIKGMISALGMLVVSFSLPALASKSKKSQGDLRMSIGTLLGAQCIIKL